MATNRHRQTAFLQAVLKGELPDCPDDHSTGTHQSRIDTWQTWCANYEKFVNFATTGKLGYSIFAHGNQKLHFFAFSAIPGNGLCPGAGECLEYCYSFKAWRFAAAYFRQLQNTLLIQAQSQLIIDAWQALPEGKTIRLYVDGDFDSLDTMKFWFRLVSARRDLNVYGYSKSWQLFLDYAKAGHEFPENYTLNLSSGSIYERIPAMRKAMDTLPIVRGDFAVVRPITDIDKAPDRRIDSAKWAQWAAACKTAAKLAGYAKSFVCPGKCYDCLPKGEHACGSAKFKNIPIVIGLH
jgi:hypothetical protein